VEIDLNKFHVPPRRFFCRDAVTVAQDIIGCYLRHDLPQGSVGGMIVEAEAYMQFNDPGCHAFRGCTNRNRAMFGPPGHAYVYFTYGNHWLFNVVVDREGIGSAVLIRALEPVEGLEQMRTRRVKAKGDIHLANGPGKLAQALEIGAGEYGVDLTDSPLKILVPPPAYRRKIVDEYGGIVRTTRIGLTLGAELPYRFYLADHPSVSVRHRAKSAD
jgi:DNA-3-methyladenine glycosylase